MSVITRELAMMKLFYNFLYEIDNEKDFVECLRDLIQEEELKNILNSVDDKSKKLFEEPFAMIEIKEHIKQANDIFEKVSEQLNDDLIKKLEAFDNADFLRSFFLSEDKFFDLENHNSSFYVETFSDSVLTRITFDNSEIYLNGNKLDDDKIEICYDAIQLIEKDSSYVLEITNYISDDCYRINFDNISVLLKAYSAESDCLFWLFVRTPWDYVISLANRINAHFTYNIATQSENNIFGLVKHLIGENYADTVPAELYHLIEKHNLTKTISAPYDLSKPYLCKKKYEPFWRDILNLISESQKSLPSYFDKTVSKEELEKHINMITSEMNALGYSGIYPDFYKEDRIIKPTLMKTYNLSHIVAFEKYAHHHIRCYSFKNNGVVHTTFFVGTVFQKSSEEKSDIYSTMFDCNGKAYFSILSTINAGAMNDESYELWTKKAIKSATKKAEFKKLDKEDYHFKSIFERKFSISFLGVLFTFVLFSIGFSLIVPLLLIILDGNSISEVISVMKSEPILMSAGVVGGALASGLLVLTEWITSKK